MKPILQAENVIKKYRLGNEVVSVLNGITLEMLPGEIVTILGTSGCGKTTFLNIAAGLERPTRGEIRINGHALNKISKKKMSMFRRRYIGFVFQRYNLIPSLNALENAILPLIFEGVPAPVREKRGRELIKLMGLGRYSSSRAVSAREKELTVKRGAVPGEAFSRVRLTTRVGAGTTATPW